MTSSEACAVAFAYNAKYVIRNRLISLFIWSNEVEPASHYRLLHIILHKRAIEELTHTRRIDLIHIERGLSKSNILYFRLICWPPVDQDSFYLKFVLVCVFVNLMEPELNIQHDKQRTHVYGPCC